MHLAQLPSGSIDICHYPCNSKMGPSRNNKILYHTFIELNNDLRVTWSTKSVDLDISDRGRQQSLQEAFRRHSWNACEWPPPKRHSHTKATIEILTNQRLSRKSEGKAKILQEMLMPLYRATQKMSHKQCRGPRLTSIVFISPKFNT